MIKNGAAHLPRLAAFLLTLMMLVTTCFTPALAADIRNEISLNVLWDDGNMMQIAPAFPVEGSEPAAYWANVDPSALGSTLSVEVICPDPAYAFYFLDETGIPTLNFLWQTDAQAATDEYAYMLYYAVDGVFIEEPIRLFVSSSAMPETEGPTEFQPFPVNVPVYYVTEDGELLDQQSAECWAGSLTTVNEFSASTEGYELTGAASVDVWVDENGVADPAEVFFTYARISTPTPEPTEEPTPTAIAEAVLPVYYYHTSGELLDMQEVTLQPGSHTIHPSSAKVEGLQLVGDASVTVNVDADGYTDLASIVFQYEEPAPTEAVLPVYYYRTSGELLDMQEVTLQPGSHTIHPSSAKVEGLQLMGDASVTVNVDADGYTDLASIVFQYEEPAPIEAVLPVYYYHTSGELLDMQEVTLQPGSHTIKPGSSKVEGLILDSEAEVIVTVSADGTADVDSVVFLYMSPEKEPVEAQVTIKYIHVDNGLIDSQTITLGEGPHTVTADSDKTADYLPLGNTSAAVTVDADGRANPDVVEFYYEDAFVAPVYAELVILYQDDNGYPLGQTTKTLTPGDHTIVPDDEQVKAQGYALVGEQSWVVHVDEDGRAEPASVVFTFSQATLKIAVHYQDNRGRNIAPDQEFVITGDGEYIVKADLPEDVLENYELSPGQSGQERITVTGGVPSKSEVYFYYRKKPSGPVAANVTVCYYDPYGNEIAPAQNITLEPGVHQVNAHSAETFRGYVLVSEPSITVEVYENGTFSPQEVAFYYRFAEEEEKTAPVTVLFRDDRGNDVAPAQTHELGEGEHTIEAPAVDGYSIFAGTDSQVTVTVRDGTASRSQVVFYYQKQQAAPTTFTIPVYYYDTMGEKVATTQYVQVGPGTYAVQANPADLPDGYELMMDPVMTVRVNRDGTTDPEEVAFYYRAPEKKATIIISYVSEDGMQLLEPFTMQLGSGFHTVRPDLDRVPNGYDPTSAKPVDIYVSREGEADPAQVIFTFERLVLETPIPVGEEVYRYAKVNSNSVAFRSEPSTSGGNKTVIRRLGRSDRVFVLQEMYNEKNEVWAMVNVNGRIGYMMSEFISVMTQEDSDEYAGSSTPVPTFTPEPTFTPYVTATPTLEPLPTATEIPPLVELVTRVPAVTPTLEPIPTATATPTATPAPTATPEPYQGYALTTRATALRTGISASDMTIMHDMEANTLVRVVNQIPDPATGEMWSIISTLSKQAGFVQDSALRYITDREAQPYLDLWEEQNREPDPTKLITPTPEPMQLEGYGIVLGDGVPFRQMQSEFSRIIDHLDEGTMVYISGQTAGEGQYWHSVNYQGRWGYIRADLVRMLTIAEEEMYLESLMASPTPATTNIPFDEEGLSSYGYVDGSAVNWREGPSTGADKVGELRRYAFCLVLGTEYVNGVNWYHVKYGEDTGYIHGDFFKQMTISELEDFLGSDEYLQGVVNNSPNGEEALDNVGFTGTGGLISAEDQWVHDNNNLVQNTVNPWRPIPTVAPILTTPTLEPLPGVTATPYVTPTPTPTFNPLPDVTYPTADTGNGGSAVVWVFVLGLLLLAVGGVFALVRHQQNKRRIALRAAQRRAQAARAQQQQRPYARTAAPNQPRTGAYPNPQSPMRRPADGSTVNQATNTYAPYARPTWVDDVHSPAETPSPTETTASGDTQRNPRVGRRTAYRQAQERQQNEGNSFDA